MIDAVMARSGSADALVCDVDQESQDRIAGLLSGAAAPAACGAEGWAALRGEDAASSRYRQRRRQSYANHERKSLLGEFGEQDPA